MKRRIGSMRFIGFLAVVGYLSVVGARTIQRRIAHGPPVVNATMTHRRLRTARSSLVMATLTVAIFVPLFLVAYIAIGLLSA